MKLCLLAAVGFSAMCMLAQPASAQQPQPSPASPPPVPSMPATAASAPAPAPATSASSANTGAPSQDIGPLKIFKEKGADINYLGRMYGLDGWLVTKGNSLQVLYTTLDGQGTVVGMLYGPNGDLETTNQLIAAKEKGLILPNTTGSLDAPPAPASGPSQAPQAAATSPSERLWKEAGSSFYFKYGPDTAPPLYVFMDPRCHFCHDYFTSLTDIYLPQKQVQLRVIPVGILGDTSVHQAQQIASATDPAAAWLNVENGDTLNLPQTIQPEAAAKIQNNTALMEEWKMGGTPGSIYRGKDGKVKLIYGVPDNLPQVIADLSSDPAKP